MLARTTASKQSVQRRRTTAETVQRVQIWTHQALHPGLHGTARLEGEQTDWAMAAHRPAPARLVVLAEAVAASLCTLPVHGVEDVSAAYCRAEAPGQRSGTGDEACSSLLSGLAQAMMRSRVRWGSVSTPSPAAEVVLPPVALLNPSASELSDSVAGSLEDSDASHPAVGGCLTGLVTQLCC